MILWNPLLCSIIKFIHNIRDICTKCVTNDHLHFPHAFHLHCSSNLIVYRSRDVKRNEHDKIGRGSFWKVYSGRFSDSRCAIKRLRGIHKNQDGKKTHF